MRERKRLLVVSDGGKGTGLARVTSSIFDGLKDEFEIVHLATNYFGEPASEPWQIIPAHSGGDPYGINILEGVVLRSKPDLIFLYNDFRCLVIYLKRLSKLSTPIPVVLYCPVDGGPIFPEDLVHFTGVSELVTCTEYARSLVKNAGIKARQNNLISLPPISVVPHATNTECFFELDDKNQARRQIMKDVANCEDLFIVLNGNRNQARKRIDITFDGFARFAKGKHSMVKLYLHMGSEESGWHLSRMAEMFGISDSVIYSSLADESLEWEDSRLNLVYNACDVGLNTSMSEGWGLVSFEHGATGAAQIVPRHTACAELWGKGNGICIEADTHILHASSMSNGWIVSPQRVADELERLYCDRDYLKQMSLRAKELACTDSLSTPFVNSLWRDIFYRHFD